LKVFEDLIPLSNVGSRELRWFVSEWSEVKGRGKAVPLQAWGGPEGSRMLRFPDFLTTAQDGGKVVVRSTDTKTRGQSPVRHNFQ
jgi:hypothetical protein